MANDWACARQHLKRERPAPKEPAFHGRSFYPSRAPSIFSAEDWCTTLVAAAGEPDVKDKLLQGYSAAGQTFNFRLDGISADQ